MDPRQFLLLLSAVLISQIMILRWLFKRAARSGRQLPAQRWLSAQLTRLKTLAGIATVRLRAGWPSIAPFIELGIILLWTLWVGHSYLSLDLQQIPIGGEFGLSIQSYFVWQTAARCDLCLLWNGSLNGGAPSFAELHGPVLHPLVVGSSLLFGAINGSKFVLLGSLFTAGIAQWWLARVLKLGWLARLWSAGMAVVGGHLAGRMDQGTIGIIVSTAACSLMLAPLLKLMQTSSRRSAIQFGVVSAGALLAGQGYLQIGAMLCYVLPALILFIGRAPRPKILLKEIMMAGLIAVLLAGIFLVPLLHFWPNFGKAFDPYFSSAQPMEYLPLNLVIRDPSFYHNDSLQKIPIPYMYMSYIGWIPVLLAAIAVRLIPSSARRLLVFLATAIGLVFFVSSAIPMRLLIGLAPLLISGIRFPSLIAGLAVPPVLALAAWGLDLIAKLRWPQLTIRRASPADGQPPRKLNTGLMVLAIPFVLSLQTAQEFAQPFLRTETDNYEHVQPVLDVMRPPTTQWLAPPYGEGFWWPSVLNAGLKMSPVFRPWHWKDRIAPEAYIEGTRDSVASTQLGFRQLVDGINIVQHAENEYAFVDTGTAHIPCQAVAIGGNIDVDCSTDAAGTLIVRENNWTGWSANLDGQDKRVDDGLWLSTAAPAGQHHFEFRYRPWDALLGLLLSLLGAGLGIVMWIRTPSNPSNSRAGFSE